MELSDANQTNNALTVYENEEKQLKHLDFVQKTVESIVLLLEGLYEMAKENAGLLKPRFESVEGVLRTVLGPVCDKFHHVPYQLLELLDRKVDESVHEVDWQHDPLPVLLRHVAEKAPEVLRELAVEIHSTGLLDAAANVAKDTYIKCRPVARELVYKYEPVAEEYAVWAWRLCNQLPFLAQVTQMMVPAAAFWAERYNQAVDLTSERGYAVAGYLPSIPVERIAEVFSNASENGFENGNESVYEPNTSVSEEGPAMAY